MGCIKKRLRKYILDSKKFSALFFSIFLRLPPPFCIRRIKKELSSLHERIFCESLAFISFSPLYSSYLYGKTHHDLTLTACICRGNSSWFHQRCFWMNFPMRDQQKNVVCAMLTGKTNTFLPYSNRSARNNSSILTLMSSSSTNCKKRKCISSFVSVSGGIPMRVSMSNNIFGVSGILLCVID